MTKKQLEYALALITEGDQADVPKRLLKNAVQIEQEHAGWVRSRGVVGFGIGRRSVDMDRQPELALKVYVKKKLARRAVDRPVPRELKIPGIKGRVLTDVEEIGRPRHDLRKCDDGRFDVKRDPCPPGFGIGLENDRSGTLGCYVRFAGDPDGIYLLSNLHVIAMDGLASVGAHIYQPSHGREGDRRFARLATWKPLNFKRWGYPNIMDAAIAKVGSNKRVKIAIPEIGLPAGIAEVKEGDTVRIFGSTSGYKTGTVLETNYRTRDMKYRYRKRNGSIGKKYVGFKCQVKCTNYSDCGDSGSVVVNQRNQIVGLHVGSIGKNYRSFFSPIGPILDALNISIITAPV